MKGPQNLPKHLELSDSGVTCECHTRLEFSVCLCPEAFFSGVLGSHGDGEHSQKRRDVLLKAQQLHAKVVGYQMLLQPPWGSPGEGALRRSVGCIFQPIHRVPM